MSVNVSVLSTSLETNLNIIIIKVFSTQKHPKCLAIASQRCSIWGVSIHSYHFLLSSDDLQTKLLIRINQKDMENRADSLHHILY